MNHPHSLTLSTKYRAKEIIADIFSITTLKELNFHINGCWNYKAGFMGILPNMTALDLSGTEIGDGQFNFSTQFPNLEVLQLENCKAITDMTLYQLAGAANLRLLSVVNIPMITDDCVNEVFNTTLSLQMIRFHGRLVR